MPQPQPDPTAPAPPNPGTSISTFSGLKNTVAPESLTARELARARNIDLDDLGQAHRRQGRTLRADGRWASLFREEGGRVFGVRNDVLVEVMPDYSTAQLVDGIGPAALAYVQVGPIVYVSSIHNSLKLDLAHNSVLPWGRVVSPSYQPSLDPGPADFWYSPAVRPDDTPESRLGAVGGRLFGPPPLASALAYHNGRIYLAEGRTLWATELFLYDFVDKTKGYRLFEADITGVVGVEDGVYVGTTGALYFLSGLYGEEKRTLRETAGVLPGTMLNVPGELVDPEGRRFPDLPRQTQQAMSCVTNDGVVVGLAGGQTYNLTRSQVVLPRADAGAALFRQQDGSNTLVMPLRSGGTPTSTARFGDYCDATIVRAGTPGQPGPSRR